MNKKLYIIQSIIILYFLLGLSLFIISKAFFAGISEAFFAIILLFAFGTLFIDLTKVEKKRLSLLILILFITSFFIMLIGTKSGRIFGNYVYLERLKVSIFEIPMIFVLNNVLILLGSFHIARNFLKSSWLKIVGGAFLVAFFDFVFEPFAIKLNYWAWTDYFRINYGGIPLQNFLAWFIIGLISSTFIYFYKQKLEPKILFAFWFSELFFFQITQIL